LYTSARETIVTFLLAAGCEVVEAVDGETAMDILVKRDGIDVVFTDIRLSGKLNGWDVGETSRATYSDMPVIYTSGDAITAERRVEGSIFLEKPYELAAVLAACQTLSGKRDPLPIRVGEGTDDAC